MSSLISPPVFSIGTTKKGTLNKIDSLYTPGPGAYHPVSVLPHNPTWKIGTSMKSQFIKTESPGPAQYKMPICVPNGPKYSIPHRSRNMEIAKNDLLSPGPATYSPKFHNGNPAYTIVNKHYLNKSEITPGPGDYNLRSDKSLIVPSALFTKEKKCGLEQGTNLYTPGVGKYNLLDSLNSVNPVHPSFTFGRELRVKKERLSSRSPGPADYNFKVYMGKEAPSITICTRHKILSRNSSSINPGPADYSPEADSYLKKSPSCSFGNAKRDLEKGQIVPGVGQYNIANDNSSGRKRFPCWKIGSSKRNSAKIDKFSPGVGAYTISEEFGSGAPKYTIPHKEKPLRSSKNVNPGPADYNNATMVNFRHNPSWKIGTSIRDDELKKKIRENFPGPANYNNEGEILSHKFPNCIFGRAYRMKKSSSTSNLTPGPGSYKIPCSFADINDYTRINAKFNPNYKYV